jgi:HPt (histidine-containing phosphotransfer) domain-containing protein
VTKLRVDFLRTHKNTVEEITNALNAGDTNTAHRLAHTLKSVAGLIHEDALLKAAECMEIILAEGNTPTAKDLSVLQTEFTRVIASLSENRTSSENVVAEISTDEAIALLNQVAPLLDSKNVACVGMLNELRKIPGANELCRKIEDFDFSMAAAELTELKSKLRV